jgi:hypothetical protein
LALSSLLSGRRTEKILAEPKLGGGKSGLGGKFTVPLHFTPPL